MTMQINIGDHISRYEDSTLTGYIAFPNQHRPAIRWARTKAQWITKNIPAADVYFRTLPNGRTLTQLLADSSIWVNYHPTMPHFGETNRVGGKEIAISITSFRIGRWTVLGTLIHELAHSNGAPINDALGNPSTQAEGALLACGLGKQSELTSGIDDPNTPYDPTIGG